MNKSQLFTQYNKARAAARRGKLDPQKVNKALGLLQSSTTRPYTTTTKSCTCPDRQHHHDKPCKHMIAEMMKYRIEHPVVIQNLAHQPNQTMGFCERCRQPVAQGEGLYHWSSIFNRGIIEHQNKDCWK